jgi:hypothetical protein
VTREGTFAPGWPMISIWIAVKGALGIDTEESYVEDARPWA